MPYADLDKLVSTSEADDKAVAEILLQHRRWTMQWEEGDSPHTIFRHHEVRRILTEGGFGFAQVRLAAHEKATLLSFRARVRNPDGRIHQVDGSRVFHERVDLGKGKGRQRALVFRFPRVEVGSILEFAWVMRYPWVSRIRSERPAERVPVRRYIAEMEIGANIEHDVAVWNTKQKWTSTKTADATLHRLELKDLAAIEDKPAAFLPTWRNLEPWWAYRVKNYRLGMRTIEGTPDWRRAVKPMAKTLYDVHHRQYAAKLPTVDIKGCKDARCKVARVLDVVRKKAEFSGFDTYDSMDRLDTILDRGTGGGFDKALLTWRLLAAVGVSSRYVLLTRYGSRNVDGQFPLASVFNHMALCVPGAGKNNLDLFVDPSCEECEVGELPSWSHDVSALQLDFDKTSDGWEFAPAWTTLRGRLRPSGGYVEQIAVTIDLLGDAQVVVARTWRGEAALWAVEEAMTRRGKDWRPRGRAFVLERTAAGTLLRISALKCTDNKQRCTQTVRYAWPGLATVHGEQMAIPLGALQHPWDRRLRKKKRKLDLVVRRTRQMTQVATYILPKGTVVRTRPGAVSARASLAQCSVKVADTKLGVTLTRQLRVERGLHGAVVYGNIRRVVRACAKAYRDVMVVELPAGTTPARRAALAR